MANQPIRPKLMQCIVGRPQGQGCTHILCLCDDLLMEILLRLPNHKSVIQSMLVCKRWAALASNPCFIPNFIDLKIKDLGMGVDLTKEHTFSIVMHNEPDSYCHLGHGFDGFFKPAIFDVQKSSLSSLSSCLGNDVASVSNVGFASSKDLLLYWKCNNGKYDFYISNVQTRQCVALPSPPYDYGRVNLVGFICDTFFSCDKEIVINASYHYSVVFLHCAKPNLTELRAHIFSSRCGSQWCNRVLSLPKRCHFRGPHPSAGSSFCFDGKLIFCCSEGIFGFDHNSVESDDNIQCHLIEWPVGMFLDNNQVGVSQGNLYLSYYCKDTSMLTVWVLKDYKKGDWTLQHRVYTQEWAGLPSGMLKTLRKYKCHRVLGFHPWCSDVIYVVIPGYMFLCNLATKMVELVRRYRVPKTYINQLNAFYAFPIIFQGVPTPLPCLAHTLKDSASSSRL